MDAYDLTIRQREDWALLGDAQLDVIVDPVIYRLGHLFLKGAAGVGPRRQDQWAAIVNDVGGLVQFFDLLVLHERVPAFNYTDTFDAGLNFDQSLGALVNGREKMVVPVCVEHAAYMATKDAALHQIQARREEGPIVSPQAQDDIVKSLAAIEYEWEPGLMWLENTLQGDEKLLTKFLLGLLIFAGYAQQTGTPHVLSPRRSLLATAAGIAADRVGPDTEAALYGELDRRFRDAGPGWRNERLPWTPSFLPWLLTRINPYEHGPDFLLEEVVRLRHAPSVQRYRELRAKVLRSADPDAAREAREELAAAADAVAKALDSSQQELEQTRYYSVEVFPKAFGSAIGAVAGTAVAGPIGTVIGGLAGLLGEEALKPLHRRVFGWIVDQLPFVSARKLLVRAATADRRTLDELPQRLRIVWETGRRAAE